MSDLERTPIDFGSLMLPVAEYCLGPPDLPGKVECRWGKRGSFVVILAKGVFHDMETDTKGGVLDFLEKSERGPKLKNRAASMQWLTENDFIQRNERPTSGDGKGRDPVATYDYDDEEGRLLFQVCRFEPGWKLPDGTRAKKTFRQRRPDGRGGWTWKVAGLRQVPFRLRELIADVAERETIFIVEGEKDVNTAREMGLPATCNAGGGGKWRSELSPFLRGADVVIIEDNDQAGQEHGQKVADSLSGIARRVRILPISKVWERAPEKADLTDWVRKVRPSVDDIRRLVQERAIPWEEKPFESKFGAISFRDMDQPWPEHEWVVEKVLAAGEVSLMAGPSGSGKTFEALHLGMSIATAAAGIKSKFHAFEVYRPGLVIYQAGESGRGMMKRWRAYRDERRIPKGANVPFELLTLPLNLYVSDEHTDDLIVECRGLAARYNAPLELIVIDTLAAATSGANENTSEDMGPVLARCAKIARDLKCAVLLVHHMNADGQKVRGWTGIQANVDGVIEIKRGGEQEVDDEGRHIRYGSLKKMKDGEDGLTWKFVLKKVVVGKDTRGKDVDTCVVTAPLLPADQTYFDPVQRREATKAKGVLLRDREKPLFRALIRATEEIGKEVPNQFYVPGGASIPDGALMVKASDWTKFCVSVALDRDTFAQQQEGQPASKATEVDRNIRDRLHRFGIRMTEMKILGFHNPYVWITGRPVDGFKFPWLPQPKVFAPPPDPEDDPDRDPVERLFDRFNDDDLPI